MSKIIICDECGKEVKNPDMFERNRWSEVPVVGGTRDHCPDCKNKHELEDLANRFASKNAFG